MSSLRRMPNKDMRTSWMKLFRVSPMVASLLIFPATGYCQDPDAGIQTPTAMQKESSAMESLQRARQSVDKFFENSSNVVCAESITQSIVGKQGKAAYREESRYTYQVEATSVSSAVKLKEFREARKVAFRDPARTLLVTNGFASLLLIVHSTYEASYQFEAAEEQTVDGTTLQEIRFKPVPGGASPAALQLRGKSYPLPLSGSIWIDKQSGAITRLTAAVDSSLNDLGLQGMRSDIHYSLIQFHDPDEAYWMPASATIDVETPLQHWRNVHRFTGYRRFKATIEVEMGKAE
jgi:hypothetical protein